MLFICSSTFIVALERIISTLMAKSYENNRSAGFLLLILQTAITTALFAVMYSVSQFGGRNRKLLYCHITSVKNPFWSIGPFSILIALQILAVIILKVLKHVNQVRTAKLRLRPDLKLHYNAGENLREEQHSGYKYTRSELYRVLLNASQFVLQNIMDHCNCYSILLRE
ncbi:unnamed protein product, partial [Cylicocyclus nassatus]